MTTAAQRQKTPWLEVLLAALPAMLHALLLLGRLHPDEVFQSLEVATNKAYGFGILAWEWRASPGSPQPWGIRNWAVPLLFAQLFKWGDAVGLSSPMARRTLVAVPQLLLHAAMLGAVWRLTARRVGAPLARWALWLVALFAPIVWFAGRTMSESFSTAFLVWGLERLDDRHARWPWAAWGGALLGLAQVTRYGSAAAILPAMAWLLVQRQWRSFALAALGGGVVAVLLGWLDLVTWGSWFHSMIDYVRYNLTSGAAAQAFGAEPWWLYAAHLLLAPWALVGLLVTLREGRWRRPALLTLAATLLLTALVIGLGARAPGWLGSSLGLLAVLVLAFLLASRDDARPTLFVFAALGYAVIVSATAHKEDRFLYPALVLLTVAGTIPFVQWARATPQWGLAFGAVTAGLLFYVLPTPLDVQRKEQFQVVAQQAKDATGFVIMNEGVWGSPGYFWLGKNVPWCPCDFPRDGCFQMASRDPRFNRGLYWSTGDVARDTSSEAAFVAAGFHVIERKGPAVVFAR